MKKVLLIFFLGVASFLQTDETKVNIIIKANVPGATIYLNETKFGVTNPEGIKILQKVPIGSHLIKIEKPGYLSETRSVNVDELTGRLDFMLKKLAAKTVELSINSNVTDADVYLDDTRVGKTDSKGKIVIPSVPTGRYSLKLEKEGYIDLKQSIDVNEKNHNQNFDLAKKIEKANAASQGKLVVKCNVQNATIFVNNFKMEQSTQNGERIFHLSLGKHTVRVEKKGYQPVTKEIEIDDAELATSEDFTLIKADVNKSTAKKIDTAIGTKPQIVFAVLIVLILAVASFVLFWVIRSSRTLGKMGKFRLFKVIGKGGIATIYKAKDLKTKKIVALKVMDHALVKDAELVYKFFVEGEAISKINEEFPDAPVVKVFDYGRDKEKSLGIPYIAMELLKGDNLLTVIKKNGTVNNKRRLYIAKEIARALNAAHKLKVFHGDTTPDNIIINGDKVTLIDFGVAFREHDTYKNMDASITGKPVYMSPEQCSGASIDAKSDVYSLGIILYFMFNGSPPFIAQNPLDIMTMHQENPLPEIADTVPKEIKKLITDMLDKDPEKRPGTADLQKRLDELMDK